MKSRALPRSYFKGLNFLLNEQPDKAIDSFLEVAKVDSQTVELHFALGNLFRRRGETERAIRMHQNLLELPEVEDKHRLQAMVELGQDFLKAGLPRPRRRHLQQTARHRPRGRCQALAARDLPSRQGVAEGDRNRP